MGNEGAVVDGIPRRTKDVGDDVAPRGLLSKKMLMTVLATFLIAGVGITSYLAGRASRNVPTRIALDTQPAVQQEPSASAQTPPQPAAGKPTVVEVPPPVARMLEAQSRSAAVIAKQRAKEQSATPAIKEPPPARTPEFRPPRRVLAARRALVQPQRVLYASRVVQLGEYPNRRQAEVAHARLVKVYPYLKTLPKTIKSLRHPSGRSGNFYLRLTAYSPDHARIVCRNLLAIGRGCAVMPEPT